MYSYHAVFKYAPDGSINVLRVAQLEVLPHNMRELLYLVPTKYVKIKKKTNLEV